MKEQIQDLNPVSIISGAVKQFGAGMLVAAVFGLAVARVYSDLGRNNELLIALVREQSEASRDVSEALYALTRQLEKRAPDSN